MGLILKYVFFSAIVLLLQFLSFRLNAQDRCGADDYNHLINPDYQEKKLQFEKWLGEKIIRRQSSRTARAQAPPYKIPVVVHIIHNGEAIGVGTNLSDAQVLSQIKVLNEDFNRQNADAINTPAVFSSVAGSLDIEFILARRDPDGLATTGIVRVNGGRNSWKMIDNYTLKSKSYWPAEQYLNIWVCNLTDTFVGYAQFPESNLEGLEQSSTNRLTDGVVVWYRAFGSGNFGLDPSFNKGRTLTHETGHFLGLWHIWGTYINCTDSDYVSDTPNQEGSTAGCPTHPLTDNCGQVIMFQNYLDYSDDACMNLFTQGQTTRMMTVIENSPRRNSLLTSPGLIAPDPLPNDLGIRRIISPDGSVCSNTVIPVIEIRNYGSNVITTSRIRLTVDGTVRETLDFVLTLNPQGTTQVSYAGLTLGAGQHEFTFRILSTNGGIDGGNYNDLQMVSAVIPALINTPFAENFTAEPVGWITQNPDGQITWQVVTAPRDGPNNKALKLNFFAYEDKIGEVDTYLSPVFDLSAAPAATLIFDVAHARFQSSNDRLRVIALKSCQDLLSGTVLYDKAGESLKTAPPVTSEFTPTGRDQWRKELIDLSAFIGNDKVQLAFVGINDWGNNIYIDNIALFTEETVDASLISLRRPSVVTCEETIAPSVLIQNLGSIPVTSIDLEYSVNNGSNQTLAIDGLIILFGEEKEIELPSISFSEGTNILKVNIKNANGSPDFNPENNENVYTIVINKSEDRIPLRQNFDGDFSDWTIVNPRGGMNWQTLPTNYNQSLYFNAFNNTLEDDEAWLVSPVIDFSGANQASMLFDLSYAKADAGTELLSILVSKDCGSTFEEIAYNLPAANTSLESWIPKTEDNWEKNIPVNLNSLAGEENVRIAFMIRHQNGNNVFLDNIDFYNTADPDTIEIDEIFSIYGYNPDNQEQTDLKITFNLPQRENVRFSIVTVTGTIEAEGILGDVLNQTFPLFYSERLAPGMYIIRLGIGRKYYARKILVR
ncbi:MAG: choice-of-anchor J domain-containing protein [Cyclobacteriaceae bacterium]